MIDGTEPRFEEAAKRVSDGSLGSLSQTEKLALYGLYAVVRKGKAPNENPSPFLDPTGFAKWTAWAKESHLTKEEAMVQYTEMVETLASAPQKPTHGNSSGGFGGKALTGFDLSQSSAASERKLDICHWAAMGDSKSVLHCLEQLNVSPNYRDEENLTPLMRAADRNEQQVVDILLEAGADINAADDDGQTALHYAVCCEHAEVAALLVTCGASVDMKDVDGGSPYEGATGRTKEAMDQAKNGTWKRTSVPFRRTSRWGKVKEFTSQVALSHVAAGAAIITIAVLIVQFRPSP